MTEINTKTPESPIESGSEAQKELGVVALPASELIEVNLGTAGAERVITCGGVEYKTDIPKEAGAIKEGVITPVLVPKNLDSLPVGHYEVTHKKADFETDELIEVKRDVDIIQTAKGKALNADALSAAGHDRWPFNKATSGLAHELGFIYKFGNTVAYIPTPNTVVDAAAKLGVDIDVYEDSGVISDEDYLGSYSRGHYPISAADETYYKHDIQDDHLFAVVLGGESLKSMLREVAQGALDRGDKAEMSDVVGKIDSTTAVLRQVLYDGQGEAFGIEMGRRTFAKYVEGLGMDKEVANQILAEAQSNAVKFSIPTTPLQ